MIRVVFGTQEATIDVFQWRSSDKALQDLLNTMRREEWLSPSVPSAERAAADDAIEKLGGRIIAMELDEFENGAIY